MSSVAMRSQPEFEFTFGFGFNQFCDMHFVRHSEGLLAPFMPDVHPDAVLILEDDAQLCAG